MRQPVQRWHHSRASDREFTPRLMKCLMRLAPFEARELDDDHVGPEHMLLALLREGNGVAVQALQNLGVDTSELTAALYQKTRGRPRGGRSDSPGTKLKRRARRALEDAPSDGARSYATSRIESSSRPIKPLRSFAVLDAIERLHNSEHRDEAIEQVTRLITESFRRRAGNTSRSTPARFTPAQERQILTSIVEHLRSRAADQLGTALGASPRTPDLGALCGTYGLPVSTVRRTRSQRLHVPDLPSGVVLHFAGSQFLDFN